MEEEAEESDEEIYDIPGRIKKTSINDRVPKTSRVDIVRSPVLTVEVNGKISLWTADCGAEASLIEEEECRRLGLTVEPTHQRARWGDGKTWLQTIGEVHFTAKIGSHTLKFSGLVVQRGMDTPVLAGAPQY